ncbi:NAD-dependent DNA ligase LigA [Lysinibacillus sp. UGB7]|uniref:NAD-dependent DNA ligase LigA n=1 Tax=Lysinibacillus sp. UGB7 TaxID=3411039 RepID=UPI003B77602C
MTQEITLFDQLVSTKESFNHLVMKIILHYQKNNLESSTSLAEALIVVNEVQRETALAIANEYFQHGFFKGFDSSSPNYTTIKLECLEEKIQVSAEEYILALQRTITVHDKLYDQNRPIITDSMYDGLYQELIRLEAAKPHTVTPNSPTQRIITSFAESLEKVSHSQPMLSLGKTTTEDGLLKFINLKEGESIIVQNKEDGLTIAADYVGNYNFGSLDDSVTRGNGYIGERVFHAFSQIQNIPKRIPFTKNLKLRFEVVVPYDDFNRVNINGEYSNPRNLASGTIRSLDGSLARKRGLKAYVIEIIEIEDMEFTYDTERIEFVKSLGFEVSDTVVFFGDNIFNREEETARFLEFIQTYDEKVRPHLSRMIDGLVIKYNRLTLREELGYTSKHPRWAIAYKFSSQDAITTLRDIVIQVGKTGQLTPVGELDPVEIGGTINSRATLHNFKNITVKDIRVGDQILLARAKDVSPQVIKSFPDLRSGKEFILEIPPFCPECGGPIEYNGENLYCRGTDCEPQKIGKLEHFVSRNAMNILGLGEKTIETLYEIGLLQNFSDIYNLKHHREAITGLEGFGTTTFDKLIKEVEKSKKQPLNNVLYSLSINLIGETASKDLARVFSSIHEILQLAENPTKLKAKILSLSNFGDKMAFEFVSYFTNKENIDLINKLLDHGLTMNSMFKRTIENSIIKDKVFVITGSFTRDRKSFKEEIESLGGKVTGSVSKKTNYLLMGSGVEGKTKHTDAIELGIKILSETDYLELKK